MPIHQAQSHVTRGREHIEYLKNRFQNVTNIEVDLTSVFETFKKIVPERFRRWQTKFIWQTLARLKIDYFYIALQAYTAF